MTRGMLWTMAALVVFVGASARAQDDSEYSSDSSDGLQIESVDDSSDTSAPLIIEPVGQTESDVAPEPQVDPPSVGTTVDPGPDYSNSGTEEAPSQAWANGEAVADRVSSDPIVKDTVNDVSKEVMEQSFGKVAGHVMDAAELANSKDATEAVNNGLGMLGSNLLKGAVEVGVDRVLPGLGGPVGVVAAGVAHESSIVDDNTEFRQQAQAIAETKQNAAAPEQVTGSDQTEPQSWNQDGLEIERVPDDADTDDDSDSVATSSSSSDSYSSESDGADSYGSESYSTDSDDSDTASDSVSATDTSSSDSDDADSYDTDSYDSDSSSSDDTSTCSGACGMVVM